MKNIKFKKTGKEIKTSIMVRCTELSDRLKKRDEVLEEILNDRKKLRSYMLRQAAGRSAYEYNDPPIPNKNDIPSEEIEEIHQLCKRMNEIEQELNKLKLVQTHLIDEDIFELTLPELIRYGFNAFE